MPLNDSVDKIVKGYFSVVTKVPFKFKRTSFQPKPLVVSSNIFKGFTCPIDCGGCCLSFTLDYLPSERHPKAASPRVVKFDGRKVDLFSDLQLLNEGHFCINLNERGRCRKHKTKMKPFFCDFDFIHSSVHREGPNYLSSRLFGRGWNMQRVDGGRGAKCTLTEPTQQTVNEVVRKLTRLRQWSDHFGIETWLPEILYWAQKPSFRCKDLKLGFQQGESII